jgi:hypothetical protein
VRGAVPNSEDIEFETYLARSFRSGLESIETESASVVQPAKPAYLETSRALARARIDNFLLLTGIYLGMASN